MTRNCCPGGCVRGKMRGGCIADRGEMNGGWGGGMYSGRRCPGTPPLVRQLSSDIHAHTQVQSYTQAAIHFPVPRVGHTRTSSSRDDPSPAFFSDCFCALFLSFFLLLPNILEKINFCIFMVVAVMWEEEDLVRRGRTTGRSHMPSWPQELTPMFSGRRR